MYFSPQHAADFDFLSDRKYSRHAANYSHTNTTVVPRITAGPIARIRSQHGQNKHRRTSRPSTSLRHSLSCTFCLHKDTVSFVTRKSRDSRDRMCCRWRSDGGSSPRQAVSSTGFTSLLTPGLGTQTHILHFAALLPIPEGKYVSVCEDIGTHVSQLT